MRSFISITCAVLLVGSSTLAAAQGKGGGASAGHAKGATYKPVSAPAPKSAGGAKVSSGPKTSSPKVSGTAKTGGSAKTTSTSHGGHAKTSEGGATTHAKTRTETSPRATTTTTGSTTTTPPPVGTVPTPVSTTPLTPVQQKLQRNTNLAAKLQSRLPAGTDLNTAAAGFRNLGQFVAAVNVSKNLGLDFPTLKTAMVTDGKSLGQAIQRQKGTTVDADHEAHVAEYDANTMIRSTERPEKPARTKTTGGRP